MIRYILILTLLLGGCRTTPPARTDSSTTQSDTLISFQDTTIVKKDSLIGGFSFQEFIFGDTTQHAANWVYADWGTSVGVGSILQKPNWFQIDTSKSKRLIVKHGRSGNTITYEADLLPDTLVEKRYFKTTVYRTVTKTVYDCKTAWYKKLSFWDKLILMIGSLLAILILLAIITRSKK